MLQLGIATMLGCSRHRGGTLSTEHIDAAGRWQFDELPEEWKTQTDPMQGMHNEESSVETLPSAPCSKDFQEPCRKGI